MGEVHTIKLESRDWTIASGADSPTGAATTPSAGDSEDGLLFANPSREHVTFLLSGACDNLLATPSAAGCIIGTRGKTEQGTGNLRANDTALPLNGKTWIACRENRELALAFESGAQSRVLLESVTIEWLDDTPDFAAQCNSEADVLVVTPDYPSESNLYLCAFAHTRNRLYLERGLKVQVLAVNPRRTDKAIYAFDGIDVLVGNSSDLEALILRKQYHVIVTHFVDMHHYRIFDACITDEQLMFIVHGPLETMFPLSPTIARPYFTQPPDHIVPDGDKIATVQRYARNDNVTWVFVSDWQRLKSEELMNVEFGNWRVIHNSIDEKTFPYRPKTADDRKNILVLRRYDNTIFHSIDIVVRCIWELSKRDFFEDLHFEIVGDGSFFEELTAPLERFDNVKVMRTFVPNDQIAKLHARNGIMLMPSRHDSHPVSMSEGASSGLVPVGSCVTSVPYFFDEAHNHTLAPAEDPIALADIIERLYRNPDEYLAISRSVAERTRNLCNTDETAAKEAGLIDSLRKRVPTGGNDQASPREPLAHAGGAPRASKPALTVVLLEHGNATLLERCLRVLAMQNRLDSIEVLVSSAGLGPHGIRLVDEYMSIFPETMRFLPESSGGAAGQIACAIHQATGAYIHFAHSTCWTYPEPFSALVDLANESNADAIVTDERRLSTQSLEPLRLLPLDNLQDRGVYDADLLTYPHYGFGNMTPGVAASTYRTACLRKMTPPVSPDVELAELELAALAFESVDTVCYARISAFWDFADRPSPNAERRDDGYLGIRPAVISIANSLQGNPRLSDEKRRFIARSVIAHAIARAVIACDQSLQWSQLETLEKDLESMPDLKELILNGIAALDWRAHCVLDSYKLALGTHSTEPLLDLRANTFEPPRTKQGIAREIIRNLTPHGVIEHRRSRSSAQG